MYIIACVQTITKLWLVPSAKQRRDPCSGPPTDSTNYRKCVSNSPSTWLAITTNKTKPFLTGQSWRVLKSGYTAGSPEEGFRRCFEDGVNQSLISSARRLGRWRRLKLNFCATVEIHIIYGQNIFTGRISYTNFDISKCLNKIIAQSWFPPETWTVDLTINI